MFKFLFKKSFYNGFDNILRLLALNLIYALLLFGAGALCMNIFRDNVLMFTASLVVILLLECFFSFGVNAYCYSWTSFSKGSIKEFFASFKGKIWHILLYFFLLSYCLLLIPYIQFQYFGRQDFVGWLIIVFFFWFDFVIMLGLQFFYPMCYYSTGNPVEILKKCFILAVENPGYSVLLLVSSVLELGLTVLLGFLIPSMGGVCILRQNTTRLLRLRSAYMDETGESKKDTDWEIVLLDEKEAFGERKLRNLFTPWRERL